MHKGARRVPVELALLRAPYGHLLALKHDRRTSTGVLQETECGTECSMALSHTQGIRHSIRHSKTSLNAGLKCHVGVRMKVSGARVVIARKSPRTFISLTTQQTTTIESRRPLEETRGHTPMTRRVCSKRLRQFDTRSRQEDD